MKTLAAFAVGAALLGQTHDLPRGAAATSHAAAPSRDAKAGAALRFDVPADHPERWAVEA